MKVLALETSTPQASLAVWQDGAVVREWSFRSDRAHNARLFEPLAEALAMGTPDVLVVGTGPGSYSGVRVAIASALGIALARGVPLMGWPSVTAWDLPDGALVVGDARRGGFFVVEVAGGRLAGPLDIVDATELARLTAGRDVWTVDAIPPVPRATTFTPTASWLARRVAAVPEAERTGLAAVVPEPVYLRAPFITQPKPRLSAGR